MNPVYEIRLYHTSSGKSPYEEWFYHLKDTKTQSVIRARIDRLAYGLAGKCEPVGQGVFELKIYFGPGYRIYFGEEGHKMILLLLGGDKSSQRQDIGKAQIYWKDYQRRK